MTMNLTQTEVAVKNPSTWLGISVHPARALARRHQDAADCLITLWTISPSQALA